MNFGFIIDNRKCIGCHACTVACKSENDVPIGVNRTWVKYIEKGEFPNTRRIFSVMRCNHCADAPCTEICPVTALFTRADGIVDFDNRRCIACKACMQACPYDALFIDPESHTAAKCNYCAHRIEIGLEPSCVVVCPEHAIISGDMDNPDSEISHLLAREQVTARKVEKGTQPKLFYIDGDELSLNPILTEQSDTYMTSSQSTGVGHFAHYAEARISKSDPEELAKQLAESGNQKWLGDASGSKVLLPKVEDIGLFKKAQEVLKENSQRVHDAPREGIIWGWEVAAYILTKAVSAGAFLIPFLALTCGFAQVSENIQWFSLTAGLLFLLLTTALLIKDLDQPKRFLYILLRPQWRSWLVRGGYALVIYGGLLTLLVLSSLFNWSIFNSILNWGTAVFAGVTAVYTAFLFAQAKGRDFWQSPMLPLHMLVHAVLAGAALFGISTIFLDTNSAFLNFCQKVLLIGLAANLIIIASELITPHPTQDAKRAVQIITSGECSRWFWFGGMLLGNILPLLLIWFYGDAMMIPAGLLIWIGIYCTEYVWVRAPQMIPLS